MRFPTESFGPEVPEHQRTAFEAGWDWIASPSGAWTGAQKVAMLEVARAAEPRPLWDRRPDGVDHLSTAPDLETGLSPLIVDTVERVAVEAGAIERPWAEAVIDELGDVAYAELVAVVAIVVSTDRACGLLGRPVEPPPEPMDGAPTGERAETTAELGAYLPIAAGFPGAHIAKSLSIAPTANLRRLGIVRALYSGTRFGELRWDDGALDRPQVELVAARTSALNECFY